LLILKKHPWYLDKILEGKDLIRALRTRHKEMETKRRKDARKVEDLQQSVKINRDLPCPICTAKDIKCDCFKIGLFPPNQVESIIDTHTTADWKDIVNTITQAVGKDGQVILDPKQCKLICALKTARSEFSQEIQFIKFEVQIYKSREYQKPIQNVHNNDNYDSLDNNVNDDEKQRSDDIVYVVRMHRLEGDLIEYRKVRKFIFDSCAEVLTGLPEWALELQEQKLAQVATEEEENYDEYDDVLKESFDVHNENFLISS